MTTMGYDLEIWWLRLRRVAQFVAADGEAMFHGLDWGKRALSLTKHRPRSGLDTAARVFWWDATRALDLMRQQEPLLADSVAHGLLLEPVKRGRRKKGELLPDAEWKRQAAQHLADPLRDKHPRLSCRDRMRDFGRGMLYSIIEGLPAGEPPRCTCQDD